MSYLKARFTLVKGLTAVSIDSGNLEDELAILGPDFVFAPPA